VSVTESAGPSRRQVHLPTSAVAAHLLIDRRVVRITSLRRGRVGVRHGHLSERRC
jgi:hypothetical protein